MFLENQNQFRDQMQMPGVTLEPAYAQAYSEWSDDNKNVLHTMDAESKVQSFAEHVDADVNTRLLSLIEAQNLDEETKKERKTLAQRGQLLLVSTDEGKTFDKYLTPEEAKTAQASSYTLYSPTFRSTTNNLTEVVQEQTLLNWVKRTEEVYSELNKEGGSIWRVEDAKLKDGKVHLEIARTARNPEDEATRFALEIEVDQAPNLPMVYDKLSKEGEVKREVPETQLDTEFGVAQEDPTLQMPDQKTVEISAVIESDDAAKKAIQAQVTAGLSTWAALEAIDHASAEQKAALNAEMARAIMERPLAEQMATAPVQNVMAAKAAMNARFARQTQVIEKAKQHEVARRENIKKAGKFINTLVKQEQKAKKQRFSDDQKRIAKRTGIGVGVGAAFAGAAGAAVVGVSLGITTEAIAYVTHLTLFS